MLETIFTFLMLSGLVFILRGLQKCRATIKGLCMSAAMGLCAFFAVRFLGEYLPVQLPLNIFSVSVSIFGGIPGVIFLLLGSCILNIY